MYIVRDRNVYKGREGSLFIVCYEHKYVIKNLITYV